MPYGHAARRRPTQQDWRVGATVKVGFLTLTITGKTARGWALVNASGKHYEFEPHCGLYAADSASAAPAAQIVIDTTPLAAQSSGRWSANDPTVSEERFLDAGFSRAQAQALMAAHRQIGGAQ